MSNAPPATEARSGKKNSSKTMLNLGWTKVSIFSTTTRKPCCAPKTLSQQPRSPSRSGPENKCSTLIRGSRGGRGTV
eukprot:6128362-Heterocapsa_arctica.AAC.1